jgi:glycosyltransferase involved in cell wall biosynthesis
MHSVDDTSATSITQANLPVPTAYFVRIPNVGDLINPALISYLTGRNVRHTSDRAAPHLLAVGSLMAAATPTSQVWGTGIMHPDLGIGTALAENVHAVRGRLTYSALRAAGIALGDVPLGDPAHLAPALLGFKRALSPRYRLGIAAHYVDRRHPILLRMLREPGVADLNVHDAPHVFLELMADCEAVLSTSLHGLIFAEALGIPSLWAKAGDEIAGGEFKFHDWFSTTSNPQPSPYLLSGTDSSEALVVKAEPRESTIDASALSNAFPSRWVDAVERSASMVRVPAEAGRHRPTPVFLISFNRGAMLKEAIAGLQRLSTPVEIVVHDNGSTHPETLAVLEELDRNGIQVFRSRLITSADELNNVNETIEAYFAEWGEPQRYVVSDCDVDLSIADPQALKVYNELLNRFRGTECVGPMLRIRDIPPSYPLFNRVMNRHIEQFWCRVPEFADTSFGQVAFIRAAIDTTFALHRAGEPFRRLKQGLRVYEPYEARHLEWYLLEEEDNTYTDTSSPAISHWNNRAERARYRGVPLEHERFHAVRRSASGALELYEEAISAQSGRSGSRHVQLGLRGPMRVM